MNEEQNMRLQLVQMLLSKGTPPEIVPAVATSLEEYVLRRSRVSPDSTGNKAQASNGDA